MRTAIVATVVAVAGLTASSAASAAFPTWSPAGAAEGGGTLTLTHTASGAAVACDYGVTADLVNDGTSNGGAVTSVPFIVACTSTVPNCAMGYGVSTPWPITKVTGDPTRVQMTMSFGLSFSGASCALNGLSVSISGTVEGDYDGSVGQLSFVAEPGLSSSLGPFTLDGQIEFRNEATTLPVDLT